MHLLLWAEILLFSSIIDNICIDYTDGSAEAIEDMKQNLISLSENPIPINSCSAADLRLLPFLTNEQINSILAYVYTHPIDEKSQLLLIPGLKDYEARDLSYFVSLEPRKDEDKIYPREVFSYAKHTIQARLDARKLESYDRDPVFAQLRYTFNYKNRVQAGFTIRRNPSTSARDMLYGAYIQLNNLGPVRTVVAGNYQADFGCGLVTSSTFHMGKSTYVLNVSSRNEGLRKYTSPSGSSLHGVGATVAIPTRSVDHELNLSAFYSLTRADTTFRHVAGANLTYAYSRFKLGFTAVEKIYSDSLTLRTNYYNQNYFRGRNQAVFGLNGRYNFGRVDLFAELAMAQSGQQIRTPRWGFGTNVGLNITPVSDVGILVLYRYYSPTFDNDLGYGFSESSRIGDENGLYLAADVRCVKKWRWSTYVDLFRFAQPKFGVRYAPSYGFDAMLQTDFRPSSVSAMFLRLRAKQKARQTTFYARYQFEYDLHNWNFVTRADFSLFADTLHHKTLRRLSTDMTASIPSLTRGYVLAQDIAYYFSRTPLTLTLRLAGFYIPDYANRIYMYEHDVLGGFSIPALYGKGARAYLNIRYKPLDWMTIYLRADETVYISQKEEKDKKNQTNIHLLFNFSLSAASNR